MWICERCVKCTGCTPQLISVNKKLGLYFFKCICNLGASSIKAGKACSTFSPVRNGNSDSSCLAKWRRDSKIKLKSKFSGLLKIHKSPYSRGLKIWNEMFKNINVKWYSKPNNECVK